MARPTLPVKGNTSWDGTLATAIDQVSDTADANTSAINSMVKVNASGSTYTATGLTFQFFIGPTAPNPVPADFAGLWINTTGL